MPKVLHTCTDCVPIDASIIDTYVALVETNRRASSAEDERETAEAARISAEEERTRVFTADHSTAAGDHTTAADDHGVAANDHAIAAEDHRAAVSDHNTAADDHANATGDIADINAAISRANSAAEAAEHMVDIHQGPAGPAGPAGVGFASVSSQQDGTIIITLTDGNTITVDLNHNHPQYLKYEYLEDESEMPATPEEDVLYLIKEEDI